MPLKDVSRLLATKRPFMFSFMERYIFAQIGVARTEALATSENFMRTIDFCLMTRQRVRQNEYELAKTFFADNFTQIQANVADGNWPALLPLVYNAPGVGQKIGSLILEMLIHYGEANQALEPKLFVPIDTHVERILSECLGLNNVPSVGLPVWKQTYQDFQQFLANNSAEGTPRIYFDYLWFVGKVFCRKINENNERYSKGYRLCSMCWIKDHCTYADKWFTNYEEG
jgi:endonuclease III